MIKIFCDFCKQEMFPPTNPPIGVGITIAKSIQSGASQSITRIEHICNTCNDLILADLQAKGLEV